MKHVKKYIPLIVTVGVGCILWNIPSPEAISVEGWHLLAIFIATILGIILKPLPMGGVAIVSLGVCMLTGTLGVNDALSGFSKGPIWLIVIAFFIARAFVKTGLGTRVSYYFIRMFGKSTLGLGYSLLLSELVLSPAIPSNTARNGGIMFPIINSLSKALGSHGNTESASKAGRFLILCSYHGCLIASAMFLTAMAGNPIAVGLASGMGIEITWGTWALAALVPGLVSLVVVPMVIYALATPELKRIPDAKAFAQERLEEMGSMKRSEVILLMVFVGLVVMWIFGGMWGVSSVATAFLGLGALLLTDVLTSADVLEEKGAWGTFIWFSVLLVLAGFLNSYGVIGYFSEQAVSYIGDIDWKPALIAMCLIYFFSHYFFASSTAHIGAMYGAVLAASIMLGAPGLVSALLLGFIGSLYGGLTHYGAGPAPVLFGAGYVSLKGWWSIGLVVCLLNLVIWIGVGGVWWKFLGYW